MARFEEQDLEYSADEGEQLVLFDGLKHDDSVILDGSEAEYGFWAGHIAVEVFEFTPRFYSGPSVLTVYPLDGLNNPAEVVVKRFDFSNQTVAAVVQSVFVRRALAGATPEL